MKKEEKEVYDEWFKDINVLDKKFVFHSVSYVMNYWYLGDNEPRKYIQALLRLEYDDTEFAEYKAIYDFDGSFVDDYFYTI